MKKIDNFLINHSSSFVCFLFAFLVLFFLVFLPFDYRNQNKIVNSKLSEIEYIEGEVIRVQSPKGKKTNYDFLIKDCEKEFYIHAKYVREYDFKEGDYIKIHYADNLWIRGSYHEIVNFEHNGKLIFSLEQYKEDFTPEVYIFGISAVVISFIGLVISGTILMKRGKPVSNIRKFIEGNKDKYGLTDEQVEEVIKQFEFSPKETKLDKPKEEIYKLFKNTIYVKNNRTYTSGLELVENDKYGEIFFDVLADTVSENELKVIYDDCVKDDGAIYLIYQINNKKSVINIYDDEVTKLFNIDESTLYFLNTNKSEPTKKEINEFLKQVEYYNKYEENIFFIKK